MFKKIIVDYQRYIVFCIDPSVGIEVLQFVEFDDVVLFVIKEFRISYNERVSNIRSCNPSIFNSAGFSMLCPNDSMLRGFEYKDGR